MNKNRLLTVTLILIVVIGFWLIKKTFITGKSSLSSPVLGQSTEISPAISPSATAPKTYIFDKNTDLEKELDLVNPQILDSDFE